MAPCVFHPIKLTKNKRVFIKIKKYIILTGSSTSMSELQKNIGGIVELRWSQSEIFCILSGPGWHLVGAFHPPSWLKTGSSSQTFIILTDTSTSMSESHKNIGRLVYLWWGQSELFCILSGPVKSSNLDQVKHNLSITEDWPWFKLAMGNREYGGCFCPTGLGNADVRYFIWYKIYKFMLYFYNLYHPSICIQTTCTSIYKTKHWTVHIMEKRAQLAIVTWMGFGKKELGQIFRNPATTPVCLTDSRNARYSLRST